VKERLRVRAAQHGHSMEAEVRDIISSPVGADRPREVNLAEAIRRRFAPLGGADDLEIPPREPGRDPPGSTDVRSRYQCDFRADAARAASRGIRLGRSAAASLARHPSVTRAEILSGIGIMPQARRRTALRDAVAAMFDEDLRGRILAFDAAAADRYAEIIVSRRQAGAAIHTFDALIAATALVARAAVVTRDTDGFAGCGLTLINPWEE
jgi:toxin FitB